MTELEHVIDRYFAMWNEPDPAQRRALIAQTWTEDGSYVDPLIVGEGHDDLEIMVQGVPTQCPASHFRRISGLDAYHDRVRFSWEVGPKGGAALAGGVDFATVAGKRLRAVTGFLDFAPIPNGS